jgi:hypothetical protein
MLIANATFQLEVVADAKAQLVEVERTGPRFLACVENTGDATCGVVLKGFELLDRVCSQP